MKSYSNFETLQVHAGRSADPVQGTVTTPIHQTNSFVFNSTKHAASLFALQEFGNIYTRLGNPTTDVFEKRVAALERGTAALATSSGQAAQFIAIQNIAVAGENIVSSSSLYGGTYNQFKTSFERLGIQFRFADANFVENFEKLIDDKTRGIYIETIGNSDFLVPDFEKFSELSKKHNIPLIVDNTFGAGGYLFRPIEHGANVVVESASKWIGGHGNSIAGIVVDGGNFNWSNGKFPLFVEPSQSYHGLKFWEAFGADSPTGNIAFALRARAEGLREWGCTLSPFNAFLLLQGVETLSLRVDRICSNALELAEWLSNHPKVEKVNYPGLPNNKYYSNAVKYFKRGFGGVLSFDLKGGRNEVAKFVESLELISHLVNVGDNKTLISNSATTTHAQLTEKELEAIGIKTNTLRISVGIEHINDIKRDLEEAFKLV